VHIRISEGIQIIPQVLSLSNLILSFRVTIGSQSALKIIILSANTQLFGIQTFVAVKYNFETSRFAIKGIPTDTSSISMQNALKAVSGTSLKVPSTISKLSEVTFLGHTENGVATIAIRGKSDGNVVVVILQKSATNTAAAVAANIKKFKLADLIKSATNIDVSGVPFIGSFVISTLAFSVSTNTISHTLLPTTYDSDSPLQAYGGTLPKGLTGFFKAEIGGVGGIEVTYAQNLLDFKVPSDVSLSLEKLLSQIPSISTVVKGLPSPLSDLLACNLVAIRFDPPSKTLSVAAKFAQITIIPNILQVRNLDISLVAILSSSGGLQSLDFNADWILQSTNIRIKVSYDRAAKDLCSKPA